MPRIGTAVKTFEVKRGSTEDSHYKITVKFHDQVVDEFVRPTMLDAIQAFELAGYKFVE